MKKIIVISIAVVGVLFSYGASYVAALTTCNESYYLQTYPDVAAAVARGEFSSGCEHYSLYGKDEGRSALAPCDEDSYLQTYPDVAEAVSNGVYSFGCGHYYLYGQDEGRRPGPPCDESFYKGTYSDVEEAVSDGVFSSGCAHFYLYGREGGRIAENPDNDGDGLTENQGDCNDLDAGINPSATEICGDGIDQNCDGTDAVCDSGGGDSGGGDSGGGDSGGDDSGGDDSGGGGDTTAGQTCCECIYKCDPLTGDPEVNSVTLPIVDQSCEYLCADVANSCRNGEPISWNTTGCT